MVTSELSEPEGGGCQCSRKDELLVNEDDDVTSLFMPWNWKQLVGMELSDGFP